MKIEFKTVTWYSKLLALIVFIGAIIFAFFLGIDYGAVKSVPVVEVETNSAVDKGCGADIYDVKTSDVLNHGSCQNYLEERDMQIIHDRPASLFDKSFVGLVQNQGMKFDLSGVVRQTYKDTDVLESLKIMTYNTNRGDLGSYLAVDVVSDHGVAELDGDLEPEYIVSYLYETAETTSFGGAPHTLSVFDLDGHESFDMNFLVNPWSGTSMDYDVKDVDGDGLGDLIVRSNWHGISTGGYDMAVMSWDGESLVRITPNISTFNGWYYFEDKNSDRIHETLIVHQGKPNSGDGQDPTKTWWYELTNGEYVLSEEKLDYDIQNPNN